ncbi:hypothetical protein BGW42_003460 [Actinomortierella wolfii]|nr:hypothetical protein BGW42_003460 [Actinomortierella wolfii]
MANEIREFMREMSGTEAIALSAFIMPTSPTASVAVRSVRVSTGRYDLNYNDYRTKDNEFATTVLEVDAGSPKNQIIIWDSIIRDPRDAVLTKKRITNKYGLIDVNRKWTDIKANVSLHWNIVPYVGFMTYGRAPVSDSITFPLPRTQ